MKNIINRTFKLIQVTYPEQNYFRGAFGDTLNIKFLPNGVCHLSSELKGDLPMFLSAKWKDELNGDEKFFYVDINGTSVKFKYKLLETNGELYFELELDKNKYIFKEK